MQTLKGAPLHKIAASQCSHFFSLETTQGQSAKIIDNKTSFELTETAEGLKIWGLIRASPICTVDKVYWVCYYFCQNLRREYILTLLPPWFRRP